MAQMQPTKHNLSEFNGNTGEEYGTQIFPSQDFTKMAENSAYSAGMADSLTAQPDVSDAGTVGTPNVTLVDNIVGGVTYKKFKFSNLKGATGAKGDKGDKGDTGDAGATFTYDSTTKTLTIVTN